MKKIIATLLTLVLTFSVGMLFACGGASSLTLDKTEVSVEKYKNTWITADYDGDKELTWSSENTAIAVVDNGMITGVGEGTTKIIVTDGKAKVECSVTVTAAIPEKFAISVDESKFSMFIGDQKTLEPKVAYDNIPLVSAGFTFSTESENISVSDTGVITANALGLATVTIKSAFEGKELSLDVEVNVIDIYEVQIQQTNVVLYPFAEYDGNTYNNTIQCTATVLKRGQAIAFNAADIKWSVAESQDVISISDSGFVTAINGGESELYASYTIEGKTVTGAIKVTVSPVEVEMPDVVIDAGLTTAFTPDFKALTGLDEKVGKIIVNASGVDEVEVVSDNGSFDMSAFTSGDATITLVTRNFAYSFSAIIYDGVISSVNDMKALLKAETGLYKFAADIDMAEYTDNEGVWASTVAFKGTIDGGKHVVRNFKTSTGLFRYFNGGTIKDIAFTDVQTIGATGVFGGEHQRNLSSPIVIDNVFVSNASNTNGWYVGLIGDINLRDSLTVSNSVVACADTLGFGAIVGRVGSYAITVNDCYLINTPVYKYSRNGENPEDYKDVHDPKTNTYVSFASSLDAYKAYLETGFEVSDFVQVYVDELMERYSNEILLLSNENVADLLTFTGKTILLTEDIDMATAYTENDGLWTSEVKFAGTFDGQGHTIKNLKTNTGLFFWFNGHFKNVALENVNMQGNAGIIAKSYARTGVSDVWVDSVYVELGETGGACNWYAGLFGNVNIGSPICLSNLYFRSNVSERAFIYGEVGSGAIDMQNCYFIGLAKEYARSLNTNLDVDAQAKLHLPEKNVYKFFKDDQSAYADYYNNNHTLTDIPKSYYDKHMEDAASTVKVITAANVADILIATTETILIAEDIDMATAYTANGGVWTATNDFTGNIVGNNHVIKNFNTNTGLFKNFYGGNVSDLAIVDVVTSGSIGVLGGYDNRNLGKPITINNVYVSIKSNAGGWYVGLLGQANLIDKFNLNNSVVVSEIAYGSIIGRAAGSIGLNNSYLIKTNEYIAALHSNLTREETDKMYLPATNVYKKYASAADAYADYYVGNITVSGVVKTCLDAYMAEIGKTVSVITSKNVAELLTATSGTYLIAEDIDMATAYTDNEGIWNSSATFNGTIDGLNHTISNFKTSTGLFSKFNGTVRNLALTDVVTTKNCGIIAAGYQRTGVGDVIVDNLFVSVKTVGGVGYCGLVGEMNMGSVIKVSNTVYAITNGADNGGILGRVANGPINLTNTYLINAKEYINNMSSTVDVNVPDTNTSYSYANDTVAYVDYVGNKITVSGVVAKELDAYMEKVGETLNVITAENVADLLTATSGDYLIVEDIDMEQAYTDNEGLWTSTTAFNGTIDGLGHTIKNLKTSSGLFKTFNGVLKNLALTDVVMVKGTGNGRIGAIATSYNRTVSTLSLDSVFVSIKSAETDWYAGAFFGALNLSANVTFSNVFAVVPSNCAYGVGSLDSQEIKVENGYFVGENNFKIAGGKDIAADSTYKTYTEALSVYADYVNEILVASGHFETFVKAYIDEISQGVKLIGNKNVADLLAATSGNYLVIEDIDMATAYTANEGVWASTSNFNGTIDGQNYSIKNFNTSTGLFANFNGKLCNIAFVDATVTSGTGVIAKSYQRTGVGNLDIENVFVSYKTGNTTWLAGGLFNQINVGSAVTLKNVYLYTPATTNDGNGLFAMAVSGNVVMENAYFVGYDGSLHHSYYVDKGWNPSYTGTYKGYATQAAFTEDYLGGSITLTGMVANKVADLLAIKTIDSTNVADLLTATSETYLVTEDIDMATAYTDNEGVWASTAVFSGNLYGGGHTISNFKTSTGLFGTFNGGKVNVKNLAFVNAHTVGNIGLFGGYSRMAANTITLDNLYVEIGSTTSDWFTGLLGQANLASENAFNLSNSVVVGCSGQCAVVGRVGSYAINMTNCYLVNTVGYVASLNTTITADEQKALHLPSTNTATSYADKTALKTAYTNSEVTGLSNFITDIIVG